MQDKPLIPGSSPELPTRPDSQWVMVFNLILKQGKEESKKTYKVNKKRLVIGSALSSDIRIQQNAVSNVHAVVEIDDNGKASIFDMASETGVFLNGKKIVSEELKDGDEVKVGFGLLTFKKIAVGEAAGAVPAETVRSTGTGRKLFYDAQEDFRPLILEDERNVIQIFDYPKAGDTCLQVVMYWGDVILDVAHIVGNESVTIGESKKSTFLVPGMHTDYELATAQGALTSLQFSGEMNGVVRNANQMQTLAQLKTNRFELKRDDLAKIQFREFTFFFSYSPVPPHLRRQRVLERDPLYMQIWFSSVGLTAAFVVLLASLTPMIPAEIEEVKPELVVKIFKPIPPPPPPLVKKDPPPKPVVEPPKVAVTPKPPPKPPKPPKTPPKVAVTPPKPTPAKMVPSQKPMVQVKGREAKPTPAGGNAGAGAKAAGNEGRKGEPNKAPAKIAQTTSKGNPNVKTPTKSQVQGPGNVEAMFSDLGGNLSKQMAAGAAGAKAAGSNLGFGNTTTEGVGGMGQIGDGKGGGGTSRNSQGLSDKGFGDGKIGKGLGAIGSGGNLSGSGVGRPSIEVGNASETIVMGGLDKSVIDEYIRRHLRQIRGCYEKQLNSNPKLAGRIATRFVISGSGRVTQAGVTSTSMGNATVEGCVLGIIRRIEFPEPLGGGLVEVDYPFSFMPGVGG